MLLIQPVQLVMACGLCYEFEEWSSFILNDTVGAKKSTYMGFGKWWLPPPPEVKKPRSLYSAASLAYLGDCIYEVRNVTLVCMIFYVYIDVHDILLTD
jgi:hypothetical protein